MDKLYFSEEHLMLRDMVRDFAVNEVRPISKDIDKNSIFPKENIKKMAELGLMGIPWDTKYSGTGMDTRGLVIAIEEIGKECASTAATMMAHNGCDDDCQRARQQQAMTIHKRNHIAWLLR